MTSQLIKRVISLLLILIMLFSCSVALIGCNDGDGSGDGAGDGTGDGTQQEEKSYLDKVIKPIFKEYPDRNTIKYSEIVYKRPDFTELGAKFGDVAYVIDKNQGSYEDQLNAIKALEPLLDEALTMYNYAHIRNSSNTADEKWSEEYGYVSTAYPAFVKEAEKLFVAAATSDYAQKFEDEYFGEGLIEEYADGGDYTDELVKLLSDEAELENQYTSLSPSTVKIKFNNTEDYVSNLLSYYKQTYKNDTAGYQSIYTSCMYLYHEKVKEISTDILVELIRIRWLIAEKLGYSSYREYAYDMLGHEYSPAEMDKFLSDITEQVVPVYSMLYNEIFMFYFSTTQSSEMTLDTLLNSGYHIFKDMDAELHDIYSYMLQYSLFDIQLSEETRYDGSYVTYLESYDAPFLFISAEGHASDFTTLFHEFGHFTDAYINYNSDTSLDLSEVSSQALELMMTLKLGSYATEADKVYISYTALCQALETLIFQGMYARFETMAYALPYDDISEEGLSRIVESIATDFGLNSQVINNVSYMIIPHIITTPFYVQSYAVAMVPSLEIYFAEKDESGSGLEMYKTLLNRQDTSLSFAEHLTRAGLSSPFTDGLLRELANEIYYAITGKEAEDIPGGIAA